MNKYEIGKTCYWTETWHDTCPICGSKEELHKKIEYDLSFDKRYDDSDIIGFNYSNPKKIEEDLVCKSCGYKFE